MVCENSFLLIYSTWKNKLIKKKNCIILWTERAGKEGIGKWTNANMEIVVFAAEITLSDISSVNVLHMGPVLSAIVIMCSYIKLLLVNFGKCV